MNARGGYGLWAARGALFLLFAAFLSLSWVGFLSSDDILYAHGARDLLSGELGDEHWHLRHTLVVPIAAAFALFGESELALILPTLLYYAATLLLTYWFISRRLDQVTAFVATAVLITVPLFAVQSTIAGIDLPELFFVVASFFLFVRALDTQAPGMFLIAGFVGGFAWLSRETAAGLVIAYALIYVIMYRPLLKQFCLLAVGFAVVPLLELVFYWVVVGDPLYRLVIDLSHGNGGQYEGLGANASGTGNIQANSLFNPFLALFVNQEFGVLYYLLIPALYYLLRSGNENQGRRNLTLLLTLLMIAWFIAIGYLIGVRELPRYFSVTTYCAALLVGFWLAVLIKDGARHRWWGVALSAVLVGGNLLSLHVENKSPMFGERVYVSLLEQRHETVVTDFMTFEKARFLGETHDVSRYMERSSPVDGQLYLYNPNRVLESIRPEGYAEQYGPRPGWQMVERFEPRRLLIGVVLDAVGLEGVLPESLRHRLNYANKPVTLYYVRKSLASE